MEFTGKLAVYGQPMLALGLGLVLALPGPALFSQAAKKADPTRDSALALEERHDDAGAAAVWRAIAKANARNPESFAHLGFLEARQEHYKEAIPLYKKALELGPSLPELRLNLGLALFKAGEPKEAIPLFAALLKEQPGNQRITILAGMAHYGLGEYAEAVPLLRDAASRDKQSLPLRLALAHSCLWSKQFQCVLDVYHEILELNAESAEADMLAGEALDELKDNAGAVEQFRAAVKANPKEPNAHFGLGYLLWAQKRFKEASEEFQAELRNDPEHLQAKVYLADAEIQLNQMNEAAPYLEEVEKVNQGIALVHLDLGIVYMEDDRRDEALKELIAAENLEPSDVNVHWRLARLYRAMGKKDESKAEFEKASDLNKAADEDLYQKIANAHARSDGGSAAHPQP